MSNSQNERPAFYEQQYIGAEDLNAAIDCDRVQNARHFLGAHTWGIAMGLQLREVLTPGSSDKYDVFIQPGYAWDGFGRPIVVLAPFKLSGDQFKYQGDGLVRVWLRYAETRTKGPRPGFEICDSADQTSRIQETFDVVIGELSYSDQHGKVTVGSKTFNARDILKELENSTVVLCDESVPCQTFPDLGDADTLPCDGSNPDDGKERSLTAWLVPLGYVKWQKGNNGGPGFFAKKADQEIKQHRSVRQYIGVVAENVYSADGVIRLRSRLQELSAGASATSPCDEGKLSVSSDVDMLYANDKLDIQDLVWVEGNLRAKGDIKLFGTKLQFQCEAGDLSDPSSVPLQIKRKEPNDQSGKDLQIVIGDKQEGKNRLTVGPLKDGDTVDGKLVVQDDGNVGVGTLTPKNTLDVSGGAVIGSKYAGVESAPTDGLLVQGNVGIGTTTPRNRVGIRGTGASEELISFEDSGGTTKWHINQKLGGNNPGLNFAETGVADGRLFIKAGGNVGIGTAKPDRGLTIENGTGANYMNVKDGIREILMGVDAAGGIVSVMSNDPLIFRAGGNNERMRITADGNVGIGTTAPAEKLDVRGEIKLGVNGELFATGSIASLRMIAGRVLSDGNSDLQSGAGFSSSRTSVGVYTVSFSTPFPSLPVVVATPEDPQGTDNSICIISILKDRFTACIRDIDSHNAEDDNFHFIAVGKR
jgi:hypothetical protein